MASAKSGGPARRLSGLAALILAQIVIVPGTGAEEPEAPDLDLLAYLGSWQEDDEEWLAVAEWDAKSDAQGEEPEAPREETDDE